MRATVTGFAIACMLLLALLGHAISQDKPQVRLVVSGTVPQPLKIGTRVRLDVRAAYRNAPPGARLYAGIVPMNGKEWSLADRSTLSVTSPEVTMGGTLRSSTESIFQYGTSNFPVSTRIAKDRLAAQLSGMVDQQAQGLVNVLAAGKNEVEFHFGFLAALGPSRDGQVEASLDILIPSLAYYYDGIEVLPLLVVPDGQREMTVEMTRDMRSIVLRVTPNRPRPPERENVIAPAAKAVIRSISGADTPAVVGRSRTYRIQVAFEGLPPGAALYVAPIAKDGDQYYFPRSVFSATGFSLESKASLIGSFPSLYAFPAASNPIQFQGPGAQLEAARLFVAGATSGLKEGSVTLTPPPFPRQYGQLELTLVVVMPSDSGLRAVMDTARLQGTLVPVE